MPAFIDKLMSNIYAILWSVAMKQLEGKLVIMNYIFILPSYK